MNGFCKNPNLALEPRVRRETSKQNREKREKRQPQSPKKKNANTPKPPTHPPSHRVYKHTFSNVYPKHS